MTHKLLLADDSVTIQRVIELTFSGENITVVTVSDGEQAIARIPIEKPDIVLADIGMPKKSGYEVSAFVKEHADLSHIPVLLLAGAFEPVDEARAREVKCDGVLVKPFEPHQVVARVRELVERTTPGNAAPAPVQYAIAPAVVEVMASLPTPPAAIAALPAPPPVVAEIYAPPPVVAPIPAAAQPDSTLDDYFDKLDAAFATLGNGQPAPDDALTPDGDSFGESPLPTIDHVLTGSTSPAVRLAGGADTGSRNAVVEAFSLLFAVEQGEVDPASVRIGPPAAAPAVTEALVDEVTRRVLERLAPAVARNVVADVVSEVAERLVREEIQRIRATKG